MMVMIIIIRRTLGEYGDDDGDSDDEGECVSVMCAAASATCRGSTRASTTAG
jgi:hypothetical protein